MDPYSDFRFRLFPIRCSMGGGPGGCFRVIAKYQFKVEELMDLNWQWKDIFTNLDITRICCQQSIVNHTLCYDRCDFQTEYSRNTLKNDTGVWSLSYGNEASYPIHTRCYKIDALTGAKFIGYGKNCVESLKELEEKDDEIIITEDQLEDDMLLEKHIKAISTLIDDRVFRNR